ncbi:hypothetical protein SBF1_8670002 [Candidatus Desulfosporosinus infrequens]|uniref:Uncharacterized protein n=1 Tax=Candidatus Desulfosporosinus infrequens TaxID=2043169 RepID=A0A2U3LV42_9FIRM|nr:hypothetical protein SBF1_8670002 [Candidatus Desulfosporosinus infrequens]
MANWYTMRVFLGWDANHRTLAYFNAWKRYRDGSLVRIYVFRGS